MPTRNVVLTDHHENIIEGLVKTGRYQNASEVLRDGLRLVEEREDLRQAKLEALREAARLGFEDFDRGDYHEFHSIDDLDRYLVDLTETPNDRDDVDA